MDAGPEPIDLRRRWLVITLATVVMQFAYWPVLAAVASATGDDPETQAGLAALGLALVPFSFMALAFGSRHRDAPMAVLRAMGLFLLIGLPLVVIVNGIAGMVAGLASGGLAALARDEELHSRRARWIGVGVATVYVLVLQLMTLEFALMSGAVLPFTVHGLVDQATETR